MKAKKWLALLLSGAMALSVGVMAACDKPDDQDPDQDPPAGGDYTVDTTEYYLAGDGAGTLKQNGWSETNHTLVLVRDETADHNVFKITIDMYAGDEFKIVHDNSWTGEMGISYMLGADEDKNVKDDEGNIVFAECGQYGGNIGLQPGHDGTYTFSLHTYPDGEKTPYITYTKDAELKALLDMYVTSDMNDFGYIQSKYEASHMIKRENDWKYLLQIEASDLTRDAEGNKVKKGSEDAQYVAVAVRNDVEDENGEKVVTYDGDRDTVVLDDGYEYNLLPAGAYTLIYNPTDDVLTITDGATEIYIVGDLGGWDSFKSEYVLTEDAEGNWGTYLTITEEDYPEDKDHVELKLRNKYDASAWYPGGDNISLTAGEYYIKLTTEEGKVEYEQLSYYIIGSVPNEKGEADDNYNFKLTEYSSVPLIDEDDEGKTDGVYEIQFGIPDCSEAYDWVAPNVFAFKVVYGTYIGGARDWYDNDTGANLVIPEVGDYKISFNTETKAIEIERIEYTVTFVLPEGVTGGPEAQTVASWKTATKPADLEIEGYTFYGWYADEDCTQKYDFSESVYYDTTIYARLIKNEDIPESVKVTFKLNNEEEDIVIDTVKGLVAQPEDPVREGHYFNGWHYVEGGAEVNFDAFVTEAVEVQAWWNEIDTHEYHIVGSLKNGQIESWNPADVTLKLTQDPEVTNENVFVIEVTLYKGDQFKILGVTNWEDGYSVDSWALRNCYGLTGADGNNIEVAETGVYTLKFYRDGGWKLDCNYEPIVINNEVHFNVNGTEGAKLDNAGDVWSGYVAVEEGDTVKLVDKGDDSEYDVEITEAGIYYVSIDLSSGEVTAVSRECYIAGALVIDGEKLNFTIAENSPKLTVANGVASIDLEVTDVTAQYDWIEGGIFACKVVYGTVADGVIDWNNGANGKVAETDYVVWKGENLIFKTAGTYTISLDIATSTVSVAPKAA